MIEGVQRRARAVGWLVLGGLCVAPSAAADFAQCADANASAQVLQRAGKFTAARVELRKCVDASCPDVVRADCAQRQEELERLQPTILFDVKDPGHHDVIQVSISIDGQKVADKVDGLAIRVDPGPHSFSFGAPGHPVTTAEFVIHEGEKLRNERIVLVEPADGAPPAVPVVAPPPGSAWNTQRVAAVVGGAVGVAGVAVGAIFGIMASSALSKSKTECASAAPGGCSNHGAAVSDYQSASTDGTVSTAAFIAGGVLVAAGVTLFFTAPSRTPAAPAALRPAPTLAIVPAVDAHTATLWLQGTF